MTLYRDKAKAQKMANRLFYQDGVSRTVIAVQNCYEVVTKEEAARWEKIGSKNLDIKTAEFVASMCSYKEKD